MIKFCASGGVLSLADEVDTPQLTPEEMKALVDEAHRLRKKVAAHCHGDHAAREAILAGVDSIEHGSFLTEETLALMKERGTYLVPTLLAADWIGGKLEKYPPEIAAKARAALAARSAMFRTAVRLGVKIGFGTDSAVSPHGINAREFALMTGLGMSPIAALKSATSVDAELLGIAAEGRHPRAGEAGRRHRHARRPDRGHHRHRARLLRHEGREDDQAPSPRLEVTRSRSDRPTAAATSTVRGSIGSGRSRSAADEVGRVPALSAGVDRRSREHSRAGTPVARAFSSSIASMMTGDPPIEADRGHRSTARYDRVGL